MLRGHEGDRPYSCVALAVRYIHLLTRRYRRPKLVEFVKLLTVAAGSYGVRRVAGEDDDIFPSAVQHLPRAGDPGLHEPAEQPHANAVNCHHVSLHRRLGSQAFHAGPSL